MSSSSADPTLSVVIGSHGPVASLEACLAALEPQQEGVEVLVCESRSSPADVRRRFAWARFLERDGGLIPELWSEGIRQSRGRLLALTIAPMEPAPDWVTTILAQLDEHDVVGGSIEPGRGLALSDWAEYFCRYARDMLPFAGHECVADLPGDNAAYRREVLERTEDLYRNGFWEPVVHRRLAEGGARLWHAPELVVRQGRSTGWRAFARQRLVHGRAHGRQRGDRFGRGRNAAGVLGSPLVPLLLTQRILREVTSKRRHRAHALLALPLIVLFNGAWALGEARGHLEVLGRR